MALPVGSLGLDSASLDTKANVGTAVKTGAKYWFRYGAGSGNSSQKSQFKLLKADEVDWLTAAKVDVVANSEWYETRCTEGGAAGAKDGKADLDFFRSCGVAKGASVYISWDAAPNSSDYGGVQAYFAAYDKALGDYYNADGGYMGIPALVHFSQIGVLHHGWIPSAASWSVAKRALKDLGFSAAEIKALAPADDNWDLWKPTKSQMPGAIKYIQSLLTGHKLSSCVWQDGNYWFNNGADENVIVVSGPLGSHLEAKAGGSPIVKPPTKPPAKPPTKHYGPMHGHGVPSLIARGSGQYFGPIDGPAASHGGYYAGERSYVKLIQQQLEFLGFVPGHPSPDGWADGIYDTRGGGVSVNGPTSAAVARFQHKHMPGTQFYGQVWWDDWTKLASLAKEDA